MRLLKSSTQLLPGSEPRSKPCIATTRLAAVVPPLPARRGRLYLRILHSHLGEVEEAFNVVGVANISLSVLGKHDNSPILNLGGQSFDLGGQTFFIQLIWGSKFVHSVDLGGGRAAQKSFRIQHY